MFTHARGRLEKRFGRVAVFLLCLSLVSSREGLPSNHQNTPDASTLTIKAKESEASITLGKDLMLGPVSAKASTVSSFNSTSARVTPAIVSRLSSGGNAISQAASRGSHNHRQVGQGSKIVWRTDSYLDALRHSRTSDDPREGIVRLDSKTNANRREYHLQGPVYKPEAEYASKSPRIVYGGPGSPGDSYSQSFKPPMDRYGPPQNPYGSQQDDSSFYSQSSSHGSSGNSYLPPQQAYGPPIHSVPSPIYGAPYALSDMSHISILPSIDLGLPFALKLNAFTIAKIILKLVIFKMIVKFIAVICLLLFIPKLEIIKKKVNKDEDDEEERSLSPSYASSKTLDDLEATVRSSVEKFEALNDARSNTTTKCTTLVCRIGEAFTFRESWIDYLSLFKNYVEEERQLTKSAEQ